MIKKSKFLKLLLILLFFNFSFAKAEIFNEIKVTGNKRLSIETILIFSGLQANSDINKQDINDAIKNLYKTNYFKNIEILSVDNTLEIKIEENPIIQTISIKGVKNKRIQNQLLDITKKSEKYPFLNNKVKDQKNLLLNIVRANGFYFSKIETKIVDNKNNSVDIIYEFNLGSRAKIKNINFQGKKIFKDSKLRNIIKSEEGKFWKFLSKDKYLDERKIKIDENLLLNFYKNKGYYNVNIKSSYAKNINNEFFELNFNIDSGEKYFFKDIKLNLNDNFDRENFENIEHLIKKIKGKKFSQKKIDEILDVINKTSLAKEFIFVDVSYDLTIVDKNQIQIELNFKDLEKIYVEQINIFGNFITEEKVIRNSLIVDEGDAYNRFLFDKSISNLKSRRIFKSVKTNVKDSKNDTQKKVIDITVQESPTGEIFAGAGTGTSGATIAGGITENNYLGKGIRLSTKLSVSEDEIKGIFSVLNPNFKNSDKSLNTIIESTTSDFLSTGGFKTSRTGFGIGTGFEQYSDLFVNLDVSTYYEKLETTSTASKHKKTRR